MVLANRSEAGRRLAERLRDIVTPGTVVLALTRGGVPVGFEIAHHLGLELDLLVVRKVGAPMQPEYGLGAVSEDGSVWLDDERIRELGLSHETLAAQIEAERREVTLRVRSYRGDRPRVGVEGRAVIVVDDGIATGGTVRAAVGLLRSWGPSRVLVAVGVAPSDTYAALARVADEVVCLEVHREFSAVGEFYRDFDPVSEAEVRGLLETAWDRRPRPSPPA